MSYLPRVNRASVAALVVLAAAAAPAGAGASSIFFLRDSNIWVANPDGSGAQQVTSDGGNGQPYVWVSASKGPSPKLAYLRANSTGSGPAQMFGTMNPDGTGSEVNPGNSDMQPEAAGAGAMVSIDAIGDLVAWPRSYPACFGGCGYTYRSAQSIGVDGSNESHTFGFAVENATFGDTAGQTLLFDDLEGYYSDVPGSCGSSNNHMLVRLTPLSDGSSANTSYYCLAGADLSSPALRPDGQAIAAVQGGSPDDTVVTIPIGGAATTDAASPATAITPSTMSADHPDFSPDGTQIAFESQNNTIYTVPAAGGTPTQILANASVPAWSPYTLPSGPAPSPSPGPMPHPTPHPKPKKRCHFVKKRVRGHLRRVKVCKKRHKPKPHDLAGLAPWP